MRIGSIIIFHLSKLWRAKFFILLVKLPGRELMNSTFFFHFRKLSLLIEAVLPCLAFAPRPLYSKHNTVHLTGSTHSVKGLHIDYIQRVCTVLPEGLRCILCSFYKLRCSVVLQLFKCLQSSICKGHCIVSQVFYSLSWFLQVFKPFLHHFGFDFDCNIRRR